MEGNAEGNTTAPNSDQDLSDGGQQRRSVRQRRARDWGDEMAPPKRAHPRGEGPSDASDEGGWRKREPWLFCTRGCA